MYKGIVLGALLGALVTAGFALPLGAVGSDLDNDLKAVSKGALSILDVQTSAGLKIKKYCACLDSTENTADQRLGFLAVSPVIPGAFTRIALECYVPRYDNTTGARTSADFCQEWAPIGK